LVIGNAAIGNNTINIGTAAGGEATATEVASAIDD